MKTSYKISLLLLGLLLLQQPLSAKTKKYTIKGTVEDIDGEGIKGVVVVLLDSDGNEVKDDKTGRKGAFKIKKIEEGKYSLVAARTGRNPQTGEEVQMAASKVIELNDDLEIILVLSKTKASDAVVKSDASIEGEKSTERIPQEDYISTEVSFEVKKLQAELDHVGSQLRDLQAKSEMWVNPLSIYSKEIIMSNGSTVFGKVVYQDEEILKVETLLGYLVIERELVVRIIENAAGREDPEYIPEQIRETYSPPPMPKLAEPRYVASDPTERLSDKRRSANIVLVGNISERKDRSQNVTFSGQVKNIGGRRADFVKVNFVFRKNWSGETQTLTTFVSGTYHTFDSGIVTDSSLLPGATGNFTLVLPSSFGQFIGYSPTIDWEEYE
ncbi:MAG TPA: carboxypeptidase regulatory-like domain-containing protein [Candidatus Marinimicrobia bacterium]|nr:carboxypeptidase regulatory-like domain-containing protein [Candidatus Neomarinimicrobiota bacterium]